MTLLDLMIIMVEKQNLIKMDRLYPLMVGELYGNNAVLYIEYTVVDLINDAHISLNKR